MGYYHDMYPHRLHILASLTKLTGGPKKQIVRWTNECELAIKQMIALLVEDVLLSYPDHTQPFHVYTNASDYQLGAIFM